MEEQKQKINNNNSFSVVVIIFLLFLTMFYFVAIPKYKDSKISSFLDCKKAGYAIQESYPEVCTTKSGKRIVNQEQLNYLQVPEWGIKLNIKNKATGIRYSYGGTKIILSSAELDDFATNNKGCAIANKQTNIYRTKNVSEAPKNNKLTNGFYYYSKPSSNAPCIGSDIKKVGKLNSQAYDLQWLVPSYKDVEQLSGI